MTDISSSPEKRVAIIHDWLTGMRGGEKVLEVLCELYPEADIFTLIHVKGSVSKTIESHKIYTSFLQKMPFVKNKYRYYLPVMPFAIEQFDLKEYGLIVSSSHCVAKGAKKGKDALNISYCYTPMRYIWDLFDDYFGIGKTNIFVRIIMKALRPLLKKWDVKSSKNVDSFIAISKSISKRIEKAYGRNSIAIYPPVNTGKYLILPVKREKFYLIVSAFAPYKRIDIAIKAFNLLGYKLRIIGEGQEEKRLKKIAQNNIEFMGWQTDEVIQENYSKCAALIFPGEEDFGMVPVEAMACGTPVIAYGKGGALETIVEGKSGLFFSPQTEAALIKAVKTSETVNWSSSEIRAVAEKFSIQRFKDEMAEFIVKRLKSRSS